MKITVRPHVSRVAAALLLVVGGASPLYAYFQAGGGIPPWRLSNPQDGDDIYKYSAILVTGTGDPQQINGHVYTARAFPRIKVGTLPISQVAGTVDSHGSGSFGNTLPVPNDPNNPGWFGENDKLHVNVMLVGHSETAYVNIQANPW